MASVFCTLCVVHNNNLHIKSCKFIFLLSTAIYPLRNCLPILNVRRLCRKYSKEMQQKFIKLTHPFFDHEEWLSVPLADERFV